MKKLDLIEANAHCTTATPGPWTRPAEPRLQGAISAEIEGHWRQVAAADGQAAQFDKRHAAHLVLDANAAFIAFAREALPIAIEEITALRKLLEDCPFGYVNGRVVTGRWNAEPDIVAWLERLYALKEGR